MESHKIYGVMVGIDQYEDLSALACATNDATDIAEVLLAGTDSSQIELLTNGAATKKAILHSLTRLSLKAGSGDTAIVYFSGHGGRRSLSADDQAYFCPTDASIDDLEETCIGSDELTMALRAIKSERLIVLLDTCYAGGLGEARSKAAALNVGLNSRDVSELMEGRGRVIMAASGPRRTRLGIARRTERSVYRLLAARAPRRSSSARRNDLDQRRLQLCVAAPARPQKTASLPKGHRRRLCADGTAACREERTASHRRRASGD